MDLFDIAIASKLFGGGGGGGSSDFSTAEVNVTMVPIEGQTVTKISNVHLAVVNSNGVQLISLYYAEDDYGIPLSDLGTLTQWNVTLYKQYETLLDYCEIIAGNNVLIIDTIQVISGDAEYRDDYLYISGDCEIQMTLKYAD